MTLQLRIRSVPPGSLPGFSKFSFAARTAKRHVTTAEVLPVDPGLHYVVLAAEACVQEGNETWSTSDLSGLLSILRLDRGDAAVECILRDPRIFEDGHRLPGLVSSALASATDAGEVVIRCHHSDRESEAWLVDLKVLLDAPDLLSALPRSIGEFEICDRFGTWYLRVRDDEPLMYAAVPRAVAAELLESAGDFVMEISGDALCAT